MRGCERHGVRCAADRRGATPATEREPNAKSCDAPGVRSRHHDACGFVRRVQSETRVEPARGSRSAPKRPPWRRFGLTTIVDRGGTEPASGTEQEVRIMYAFGAILDAFTAIPTASLSFDATPLGYLAIVLLAALVGSGLGIVMRLQHVAIRPSPAPTPKPTTRIHGALPRPA
jgi:hypothetical protein